MTLIEVMNKVREDLINELRKEDVLAVSRLLDELEVLEALEARYDGYCGDIRWKK
jgi:hypothetical protein